MAKIMIPAICPFYPIPSLPTGWTNWPIMEAHISKLKWLQIFSVNISTFILFTLKMQNKTYLRLTINRTYDSFYVATIYLLLKCSFYKDDIYFFSILRYFFWFKLFSFPLGNLWLLSFIYFSLLEGGIIGL